jgi:hypothetical protein
MNSRRKHTSPKNKEKKNGWDPPSSTHMGAANCRAALGHIDRQIVAWAVARGRRAQGHRLKQKKAQVRHIADLILNLKMRDSNYVKFNKWRKYGIKIRLHSLGHKRMDRGAISAANFCWTMMYLDIKDITAKNADEIIFRIEFLQELGMGPWVTRTPLSEVKERVQSLIGYKTNIKQE